ncbi:major capsid protein [Bifidobacterium eulemuris]|uniref:Major capsid protein n=1 Tax=Bifidobacterium eulemuris TaxID=1765219 RepID=A0A261GAK2_9BIFI|nr:major capsid protein [Bifidobacterium eulemuris]OZG68273.1 minor capsid protein E [Bifidobacterium eulemuris]QOL31672.1 major capsid protein [Bifidobacterium eulemuris]
MALINQDFITPAEASGIVLGAYQTVTAQLPFSQVLPDINNPTGLRVDWIPNQARPEEDEMHFGAWDAEAEYGQTKGGEKIAYTKMLPLRKRMRISEYDIAEGKVDLNGSNVADSLREYFLQLGKELAFRLERARVTVTVDAALSVDEHDVKATWDYQRDASLTVTAAQKWNVDGDPVADTRLWADVIDAVDGYAPTVMLMTRKVMRALEANPVIIRYAFQGQGDTLPNLVGENVVRNVMQQMAGIDNILIVDDVYKKYAQAQKIQLPGGVKSFFPEDTVLLLPDLGGTDMGYTALGPTAEAKAKANGISREHDAGPVGLVTDIAASTPGYEAYATATALPVLIQSNSTLKATVL